MSKMQAELRREIEWCETQQKSLAVKIAVINDFPSTNENDEERDFLIRRLKRVNLKLDLAKACLARVIEHPEFEGGE